VALSKAYVIVTLDPIKGISQAKGDFWGKIKEVYDLFLIELGMRDLPDRDSSSLDIRFRQNIQKACNHFMPYLKQVIQKKPSGTTKNEWLQLAAEQFREVHGRPFTYLKCFQELQDLPKFNVMEQQDSDDIIVMDDGEEEEEQDDKKPAAVNNIGSIMGSTLRRPMGARAAKRLDKEDSTLTAVKNNSTISRQTLLICERNESISISSILLIHDN